MAHYLAVIFDIDGTLLDSNSAHAQAFKEAFDAEGLHHDFESVRQLIGMGSDHLIPTLTGIEKDSERGKRISARKKQIFSEKFEQRLRPFPKAKELVEELHRRGFRIAVATSADRSELERFLGIIGIESLVEQEISKSDAASSKPDPDVIQAALKRLDLKPDEALMIGDTPYDISAAKKAGVATLALRSGGWGDEPLHGALAIYDDPADLLRKLDSSPLASDAPASRQKSA